MRRSKLLKNSRVPRKRGNRAGFTLMEILVALGILMIGLTGAIALLGAATTIHKKSVDQVNAAFIAQTVIAEVESQLARVEKVEELEVTDQRLMGYPLYSYDIYLQPLDKRGWEILVAVSVSWDSQGKRHAKTFRTILLKRELPLDHPSRRSSK